MVISLANEQYAVWKVNHEQNAFRAIVLWKISVKVFFYSSPKL